MPAIPIVNTAHQQTASAIDAFMTELCPTLLVDLRNRGYFEKLDHVGIMIDTFYETLDTVLGEHIFQDAPALGFSVSCKIGCSHCCKREVKASLPEIIASVVYLNENPKVRNAFLERFSRSSNSCNFLVDDKCSIYAMRPIECREVVSLDDPVKCRDDFAGKPVLLSSGFLEDHKTRTLDAVAGVVTRGFGLAALPVGRFDSHVYNLLSLGSQYFNRVRSL